MADGSVDCGKEDCDEELDELLDSALEDFDKTTPSVVKQPPNPTNTQDNDRLSGETSSNKSASGSTPAGGSQPDLSGLFAESFGEASVDLENAMKTMLGGDTDLMAQLNQFTQAAVSAAKEDSSGSLADLESSLSKTLNEMAKNAKDIENCSTGDMAGEDFLRAMTGMNLENSSDLNFMPIMQTMMKNLLSKEVLYPALKDLQEKYPPWLEEKKSSTPQEEYSRYSKQSELVCQICSEYEAEKPEDSDEVQKRRFETLMELMQKMQECGQPPTELVGEMPPGLSFDAPASGFPPEMPEELQNECKMS